MVLNTYTIPNRVNLSYISKEESKVVQLHRELGFLSVKIAFHESK